MIAFVVNMVFYLVEIKVKLNASILKKKQKNIKVKLYTENPTFFCRVAVITKTK
jgi:hypothetical protein